MMEAEQPIIIQLAPIVPIISYENFAKEVGMSVEWVEKEVREGKIPIMPKKGKQKPFINLALYWKNALEQPY